mmetsp:Transcript_6425/g.8605  ORF Transcript_6425/g.8605 Transcript_6425/m.8605 type:complete len:109 (+) Transcript_6425:128-454(+)
MTEEEIAKLDPFEGFPTWYNREKVQMMAFREGSWQPLEGQAYIQVTPETYEEPALDYKIACCKTIYLHHKLIDEDADSMLELDIVNACDGERQATFIYSLSDGDLAEL